MSLLFLSFRRVDSFFFFQSLAGPSLAGGAKKDRVTNHEHIRDSQHVAYILRFSHTNKLSREAQVKVKPSLDHLTLYLKALCEAFSSLKYELQRERAHGRRAWQRRPQHISNLTQGLALPPFDTTAIWRISQKYRKHRV
mgnify:CR=1 FL=1